jgi:MFS family permease
MYFKLYSGKKIFIQNKAFQFIFITFIISIGLGMFDGIFSLYLESILKNPSLVGFVSALIVMVTFFTYIFLTQIYSKYPVVKVWLYSTLILAFSLFLLYFFKHIIFFAIFLTISVISLALNYNTSAIILRHSTTLENLGKIQGYNYALRNLGWVIGPLLSSFILYKFGLLNNFLAIGFFIFFGWLLFLYYQIKAYEENKPLSITLRTIHQNILDFFRNKELLKLFFLRGSLSVYWSVIYIFTPLFILLNNLKPSFIGLFLGFICMPLIILELQIGKILDFMKIKRLFVAGAFFILFFLFLAFFINHIYFVLAAIFLSIIGAAFLEPTCETYFFRNVNQFMADRYYGVYRTSDSVFSLVARLLFGFILLFLSIKFVYLFTAMFFIITLMIAYKVKG